MSENSPENSRKFPMIYTVGLFVERFQPLACALFGTWLAHEYLKPNLDLFVPGIFMAFFGGVMFVIEFASSGSPGLSRSLSFWRSTFSPGRRSGSSGGSFCSAPWPRFPVSGAASTGSSASALNKKGRVAPAFSFPDAILYMVGAQEELSSGLPLTGSPANSRNLSMLPNNSTMLRSFMHLREYTSRIKLYSAALPPSSGCSGT